MAKLSSLLGGIETGTPLVPGILAQTGVYPTPSFDIGWKRNKLIPDQAPGIFARNMISKYSRNGLPVQRWKKYLPPFREEWSLEASEVIPTRNEAGPV